MNKKLVSKLRLAQEQLRNCRSCPNMIGTPVHGAAIDTPIMLVGQAPGPHESDRGKPFAYTAGKTLFKWFYSATGISENDFRDNIYISAVARCFPGKNLKGAGDREPSKLEIETCRQHLSAEVSILKPKLILAVGKIAIKEVLGSEFFTKTSKLSDVVGRKFIGRFHEQEVDVICLPHPSGVSRWPNTEIGKIKLAEAMSLIKNHPVWKQRFSGEEYIERNSIYDGIEFGTSKFARK